jgi:mannose-6-phosphate isomerase
MARAGFERENLAGIPLDAPERCYVDPNPKPELICALTPFRALNRFRALEEIAELFGDVGAPELRSAIETMRSNGKDGVRRLLRTLLMLDTPARRAVLDTGARWARGASGEPAAECLLELSDRYPNDIGALAPLLLNLVELQPGEAMFLPPGELHAYLSGTGLELMANSDNVLRGGLTSKHVDEEALLDVLQYRMGPVERLHPRPVRSGESIYETPAEQFALSVIDTNALLAFQSTDDHGVEILLCTSGECDLTCLGQRAVRLTRGASVFVPASAPRYAITGRAVVYRAHVPHD